MINIILYILGGFINTMPKEIEYFTEKNRNIIIYFDQFFNNSDLRNYNIFKLAVGKKRVYAMFAPEICKDNNHILSLDKNVAQQVIYSYLTIKKAIDEKLFVKIDSDEDLKKYGSEAKRDFGKYKDFINFMITNLFTKDFIDLVKKYVSDNYTLNIDETESEKYPKGTTFNNEHFKLLNTISVLSKFAIPLCTHYIYVNSDKNIEVFNFMFTVFNAIFEIVAVDTNCGNLMNKLYQFVDRIVSKTENSNKVIWDKFPIYNETKASIIEDLVVKIVTTIIPKFDIHKSIISLISVVARDSVIKYKIGANNDFDCFRINDNDSSNDDEDKLSETDIFDLYYRPQDETIMIFNNYANDDAIEVICRRNNIIITPEEFEFYRNNYKIHNLTVNLVTQVFARFFSGTSNVRSCNFDQFIKLMIVLIKKMKDLNINYLPQFVTATRESYSFTRMPSASVLKALKNNPDYNDLIEMKYRFVQNIFDIKTTNGDDRNPIKDMIVGLIHNDYNINEWNNPDNGKRIEIDEEKIINDVLAVYKRMII